MKKFLLIAFIFFQLPGNSKAQVKPELVVAIGHSEIVSQIAVSPDSRFFATSSWDNSVKLWNVATGREIKSFRIGTENNVYCVAFSPDGKKIASGSYDKNLYVYDLESGQEIIVLKGHTDWVTSVVFAPDGRTVFTGSPDKTIRQWDIATGKELKKLTGHAKNFVFLSIAPDQRTLISGSFDQSIKFWDIEKGKNLGTVKLPNSPWSHAYSNDGMTLLVSYQTGSYPKYTAFTAAIDLATQKITSTVQEKEPIAILLSGSGNTFLLTGDKGMLVCREFQTRSELFKISTGKADAFGLNSMRCGVTPDGKSLIVIEDGKNIQCWNPLSRTKRWHDQYTLAGYEQVAPISGAMQFTAETINGKLIGFDLSTGKRVDATKPVDFIFQSVYRTRLLERTWRIPNTDYDVKVLKDKDYKIAGFWRNDKKFEFDKQVPFVGNITFSHDGKIMATGDNESRGSIRLWDVTARKQIREMKGHRWHINALAFSSDDRQLISGGFGGNLRLWDLANFSEIRKMGTHGGNVRDVKFVDNDQRVLSASEDGTLRLWNITSGDEILRFHGDAEGKDWVTVTPDLYYYGSKNLSNMVHFTVGLKTYTFDQFDLQFNRPDMVLERLGKAPKEMIQAYKRAYEKRLRKMGLDPAKFSEDRSFNVPEVKLTEGKETFFETNKPEFTVSFSAVDQLFKLERIFVDINGVPFYGVKGKSLGDADSKDTQQSVAIPLAAGKNVIKLSVLNEKGVESLAERITVHYKPSAPVKSNLHVVAIGISKFVQQDFNLTYADKDANDLAALLKSAQGYGSVTVHALTNEQATRENVLKLRQELEKTAVDDQVIVFAASHGVLDDELDYYIAMHDMDFSNPKKGGLRYDELENLIDAIPARNKLVLIDACHSGEVDKEESQLVASVTGTTGSVKSRGFLKTVKSKDGIGLQNSFELMKELFSDLRRNNGAVVISSASGKEYAFESAEWKNGVFTYSLIEALKSGKADADKDKKTAVSELRDYVGKRVQELTAGKQNPTSRTENLENDFRVW